MDRLCISDISEVFVSGIGLGWNGSIYHAENSFSLITYNRVTVQ